MLFPDKSTTSSWGRPHTQTGNSKIWLLLKKKILMFLKKNRPTWLLSNLKRNKKFTFLIHLHKNTNEYLNNY